MQRPPIEENIPNIKTLAEQMVRINFGYQLEDLEQNKLPENINSKMTFQKKNTFNVKNPNPKTKSKFIRNDSDLSNLSSNKSKKKSNQSNTKSEISEFGKIQDGSSNIINTNANLNTNINTTGNLNSRLNTNNNIININTNIDNNNKKDDDLYSDKNSQIYPINENSSNMSNSNNKDNLENKDNKEKSEIENENENENTIINMNEVNESTVIKKDPNVTVEIINPVLLKKFYNNDSFDDNNNKKKINNKVKKSKMRKSTLYEREKRNLERKNNKLEKKREQLKYDILKHLKPGPEIDPYSEEIIEEKEIYVPIDKRAAKIHSLKISQRILNEENNRIKQKEKEDEELKKDISRNKLFDQDEWDNFIERQYLWKNELEYKKKAAQIYKNNENKDFFKPKINSKSKSIIQNIQYGNDKVIDEVYVRLYNDFVEHKERQKLRNDQSLPTFKPKIYKNSSQKNLNIKYNLKGPNKSGTTPLISIRNNNKMKKNYSIASSTNKIVNKKKEKAKSEKLFCDLYNNNIEKYLNKLNNIKSSKNQNTANKTQGVTQPTNNTHTNANYTDINTDLINSKYIFLEKPFNNENKIKKNQSQPQIKPKIPFLPLNIKKMIEKNCNEENEEEENIDINNKDNNNNKGLNNNNYKFGITEHSNYEDGQSNFEENSKYYNENNNENEESEDINNLKMDPNDNEGTKKIFSILNNNNSSSIKLIEKYNDFEKGKKFYGQSQNETINSDDSKYSDINLYKLNIRDSTPQLIKQDIIMGNKDYSDFFDIPDMSEDN